VTMLKPHGRLRRIKWNKCWSTYFGRTKMINIISSVLIIVVLGVLLHGAFLVARDKDREWHRRHGYKIEVERNDSSSL